MTRTNRFYALSALAIAGLTLATTAASASVAASSSLSAGSGVGIGQIGGAGDFDISSQSSDGSPVSASVTNQTFAGMDSTGATRTMTFNGVNQASASFAGLHVYSSASVSNLYYNPANTKADDGTGTLNPAGSPDFLYSLGFAEFTDTLQFGGALQAGYKARYVFHVDGTMSDNFPITGADMAFSIFDSGKPDETFFVLNPGFTSTTWATQTYDINGITPQTVNVQFSSQVAINAYDHADGDNYTGYADFGATLTLDHIDILDANGNPVAGVTATSSSGTSYTILPEPSSLLLSACALTLPLTRRRK